MTDLRKTGKRNNEWAIKHGMFDTPEYRAYHDMKSRCLNPKTKSFHLYGGRGIKICERWLASFNNFFQDMKARPGKGFSLDRIDSNGNYCPENCRWADSYTQGANTRRSMQIPYKGQTVSLSLYCKILKIPYKKVKHQIYWNNLSLSEAIEAVNKPKDKVSKVKHREIGRKVGASGHAGVSYCKRDNNYKVRNNDNTSSYFKDKLLAIKHAQSLGWQMAKRDGWIKCT